MEYLGKKYTIDELINEFELDKNKAKYYYRKGRSAEYIIYRIKSETAKNYILNEKAMQTHITSKDIVKENTLENFAAQFGLTKEEVAHFYENINKYLKMLYCTSNEFAIDTLDLEKDLIRLILV